MMMICEETILFFLFFCSFSKLFYRPASVFFSKLIGRDQKHMKMAAGSSLDDLFDNRVTILVVGDYHSGKSSICQWLALENQPQRVPSATIGCDILCFEEGFGTNSFIVDLRDIGGHSSFATSRSVFMQNFDAVIVVFDVSKVSVSSHPEKKWINELEKVSSPRHGKLSTSSPIDDIEGGKSDTLSDRQESLEGCSVHSWIQGFDRSIPLMLVGNKIDLLTPSQLKHECSHGLDVEFTSTFDPHFNTKRFHDFFHIAHKQKVGETQSSSSQSFRSPLGKHMRKKTQSPSIWK